MFYVLFVCALNHTLKSYINKYICLVAFTTLTRLFGQSLYQFYHKEEYFAGLSPKLFVVFFCFLNFINYKQQCNGSESFQYSNLDSKGTFTNSDPYTQQIYFLLNLIKIQYLSPNIFFMIFVKKAGIVSLILQSAKLGSAIQNAKLSAWVRAKLQAYCRNALVEC